MTGQATDPYRGGIPCAKVRWVLCDTNIVIIERLCTRLPADVIYSEICCDCEELIRNVMQDINKKYRSVQSNAPSVVAV